METANKHKVPQDLFNEPSKQKKVKPTDQMDCENLDTTNPDFSITSERKLKFIPTICRGCGAQGVVYEIFEYELRSSMVLKIFHSSKIKTSIESLKNEGKILKMIQDPSMKEKFLKVYHIGMNERKDFQIFMESGLGDLHLYNQFRQENKKPFTIQELEFIASSLISSIKMLRDKRIFHRDIKPMNIILTQNQIKLTDFSLSAIVPKDKEVVCTKVVGTPRFMMPELVEVIEKKPSRMATYNLFNADIYSIGKTIELLYTGDFEETENHRRKIELVELLCQKFEINNEAFGNLEAPQGWEDDKRDFVYFVKNENVRRMDSDQLIASLQSYWQYFLYNDSLELAEIALKQKEGPTKAEIKEFNEKIANLTPGDNFITKESLALHETKRKLVEKIVTLSQLYCQIGITHEAMNNLKLALEFQVKSLQMKEEFWRLEPNYQFPPNKNGEKCQSYNNIANLFVKMNLPAEAEKYYRLAIKDKNDKGVQKDASIAKYMNNIGMLKMQNNQLEEAKEYLLESLKIREDEKVNEIDLANSYLAYGTYFSKINDYKSACEYFEKGTLMRENKLGSKHPDVAKAYSNWGSFLYEVGEKERGFEMMNKSLILLKNTLGPNHNETKLAEERSLKASTI